MSDYDLPGGSVMFPREGGPDSPKRSAARKPSSRPASVRSYGRGDDGRSVRSMAMGGSRPPSPSGGHKGRTLSMVSTATPAAGAVPFGYVDVVRSAQPVLHGPASLPGSTKAASGRAKSVTGESTRGGPMTDAGVREADEREHDLAISSHGASIGPKAHADSTAFDGPAAGPPVKFAARSEYFTPQSAWYLVRTLVGMELQAESDQLYRLSSLHGEVRRAKGSRRADVRSEDGSDDSSDDDEDIDDDEVGVIQFEGNAPAAIAPILRYLVKNFFLTLPLVRDVTAPEGSDLAGSDLEAHPYWTHGILPILRAMEDADLAAPVDLGRRSLGSILFGIYGRQIVERFVTEGIKLSPAYQGEAGDGMRREDIGQNPLMTLDLPRQPATMSRSNSEPMLDTVIPRSESGPIASGASTPQRPNRFSNLLRRSFLGTSPVVAASSPVVAETEETEEASERPLSKRTHSLRSPSPEPVIATPARSIKSEKTVLPTTESEPVPDVPSVPSTPHRRNVSDVSASTSSTDPNGTGSTTAFTAEDGGNETDADADPLGQRAIFQSGGRTSSPQSAAMHTAPQTPAAPQTPTPRESDQAPVPRSSSGGMLASWVGFIAGVHGGNGATDTPEADKTVRLDPVTPSKAAVGQLAAPALIPEPSDMSDADNDDTDAVETPLLGPRGGMLFPNHDGEPGAVVPAMAFSTDEERLHAVQGYDVPDTTPSSPESSHPSPRTPSFNGDVAALTTTPTGSAKMAKIQPPPRSTSHQPTALAPPLEDKAARKRREKEEKAAAKAAKAATTPAKKRFTFFGGSKTNSKDTPVAPSSLAAVAKKNKSTASLKESISSPMLIHSDEPTPPMPTRDVIAAMALPDSFAPETGRPIANGQLPHQTGYAGPVAVPLVPKRGHAWPWGAPVPFWKGTPVHRVEWGGFEADVVGVRKTFAGRSYIIRVRRPQRLDEFVLRDEGQFKKYLAALDAMYPSAHVRRIPADSIKPAEDVIDPAAPARAGERTEAGRPDRSSKRMSEAVSDDEGGHTRSGSRFSRSFRAALADRSSTIPKEPYRPPTDKARRKHNLSRQSAMDLQSTGAYQPAHLVSVKKSQEHLDATGLAPPYDAHRRALRAWLRDTLSIRTVGHNKETAAFLLLGPIQPKEADLRDMARRTVVDEARRKERIGVAQTAADRARNMHMLWTSTASECINGGASDHSAIEY